MMNIPLIIEHVYCFKSIFIPSSELNLLKPAIKVRDAFNIQLQ